jgi:hypothetical protein
MTISDLVNQLTAKTGEKVSIRRFTRYKMGEGIGKACRRLRRRSCGNEQVDSILKGPAKATSHSPALPILQKEPTSVPETNSPNQKPLQANPAQTER